jgi:CubicO group peptidase (beta-lactamase class C family)
MSSRRAFLERAGGAGLATLAGPALAVPPGPHAPIQASMQAWVKSGRAAGVSVGVSRGGRVEFAGGAGFASLQERLPARADTIYRVGSVQKQFTAAAFLRLCDAGLARLDDPLSRYLPRFPHASDVSLRQLLSHTSGLHNYTDIAGPLEAIPFLYDHSTADWVAHIARQKPLFDFAPGTRWKYSNSGFFLVGAVIEEISRMPFAHFLDQHITRPLGLKDTAIDTNPWSVAGALLRPQDPGLRRARGYERTPGEPPRFHAAQYVSLSVAGAAGALRSTALDLLAWHEALLGGRVLSATSLAAMTTPSRLRDGRPTSQARIPAPDEPPGEYGLGLRISTFAGRRRLGHEGDIEGFNAIINSYPDDGVRIAVLANTPAGAVELERRVAQIVFTGAKAGGIP